MCTGNDQSQIDPQQAAQDPAARDQVRSMSPSQVMQMMQMMNQLQQQQTPFRGQQSQSQLPVPGQPSYASGGATAHAPTMAPVNLPQGPPIPMGAVARSSAPQMQRFQAPNYGSAIQQPGNLGQEAAMLQRLGVMYQPGGEQLRYRVGAPPPSMPAPPPPQVFSPPSVSNQPQLPPVPLPNANNSDPRGGGAMKKGGLASIKMEHLHARPRTDYAGGGHVSDPWAQGRRDTVPSLLDDGEYVMTKKAVAGAGQGDPALGATRMYGLMRKLENQSPHQAPFVSRRYG